MPRAFPRRLTFARKLLQLLSGHAGPSGPITKNIVKYLLYYICQFKFFEPQGKNLTLRSSTIMGFPSKCLALGLHMTTKHSPSLSKVSLILAHDSPEPPCIGGIDSLEPSSEFGDKKKGGIRASLSVFFCRTNFGFPAELPARR